MLSVVSVCLPGPNVSPNSPEVDELRDLRLAHDQLRAVLDLLVLVGEAVGQRVARVVGPLDDVDELFLQEIDDGHRGSPVRIGRRPRVGRAARRRRGGHFFAARRLLQLGVGLRPSRSRAAARGSAPGIDRAVGEDERRRRVDAQLLPERLVAASGVSQSPLLSGSLPEAKNSSQAFSRSGAHQIIFDLRAASGMQLVDREQERVDRHVVDALQLVLEPRAERAVGVGEDASLRCAVALDLLDREVERQAVEGDAVQLAQARPRSGSAWSPCRRSSRRARRRPWRRCRSIWPSNCAS